MPFTTEDVIRLSGQITPQIRARYYHMSEGEARLRPEGRPTAWGWHIVLTTEHDGREYIREIVLSPTNSFAILNGLDSPLLTQDNERAIMRIIGETERKMREDIAFALLRAKELAAAN